MGHQGVIPLDRRLDHGDCAGQDRVGVEHSGGLMPAYDSGVPAESGHQVLQPIRRCLDETK